jgi:hypothetical protein
MDASMVISAPSSLASMSLAESTTSDAAVFTRIPPPRTVGTGTSSMLGGSPNACTTAASTSPVMVELRREGDRRQTASVAG